MAASINRFLGRFYTGLYVLLAIFLFTISSVSSASPFDEGNKKNGKALHIENCSSCHDSMFPNGKGDNIYDEDLRKIKSSKALYSMVEFCATNNGLAWFEEDIIDVSKYLNQKFYKFEN
ncbi:MAG: hypothetical protein CMK52_03580 [Proteobacteria bacterium]|nr:hypothetical protein [Pseudomonadota bacterium]|tara:strand:- start:2405 stop:2761 length:357 start_codon:yes stop_codon:yes gene_type:complete